MLLLMILSQFLVKINIQATTSFKPKQRCYHTATFINKKLYISGGQSFNGSIDIVSADFFILIFLFDLITLRNYYGIIYQIILPFHHILLQPRPLKVVHYL